MVFLFEFDFSILSWVVFSILKVWMNVHLWLEMNTGDKCFHVPVSAGDRAVSSENQTR
jgi:hypothetical protein